MQELLEVGGTQPFHAEFKVPNVSNAMDHTNPNIIVNSDGVAKLMPR